MNSERKRGQCTFFIRGLCLKGDQCRFQHSTVQNSMRHPVAPPARSDFRRSNPQSHVNYRPNSSNTFRPMTNHTRLPGSENGKLREISEWAKKNFSDSEKVLDIIEVLQKEARAWLKSIHVWRFTSRSIFPGGTRLETWQDYSFEEIRWDYYVSKTTNTDHLHRKHYSQYFGDIEKQLVGLTKLDLTTLDSLRPHIQECLSHQIDIKRVWQTDVEMADATGTSFPVVQLSSTTFSSPASNREDILLEEERAIYNGHVFEFGQIPIHPPE